jgi:hypothetical protein
MRVHHHNTACMRGRDIDKYERDVGTGGYRLCGVCRDLDNEEPLAAPVFEKKVLLISYRQRARKKKSTFATASN